MCSFSDPWCEVGDCIQEMQDGETWIFWAVGETIKVSLVLVVILWRIETKAAAARSWPRWGINRKIQKERRSESCKQRKSKPVLCSQAHYCILKTESEHTTAVHCYVTLGYRLHNTPPLPTPQRFNPSVCEIVLISWCLKGSPRPPGPQILFQNHQNVEMYTEDCDQSEKPLYVWVGGMISKLACYEYNFSGCALFWCAAIFAGNPRLWKTCGQCIAMQRSPPTCTGTPAGWV